MEDVEHAVVVEVGEAATPRPAAAGDAGFFGGVLERAVTLVPVQPVAEEVALLVDRRDEPVHVAVVVVVADGGAHAGLVDDHATVGDPPERAVAVVLEDLARFEIPGDQEIRVAVVVDVAEVRRERPVEHLGIAFDQERGDAGLDARRLEDTAAVVPPQCLRVRALGVAPVGEHEIEVAVEIVVAKRRGDGVVGIDDETGRDGHVDEHPVPVLHQMDALTVDGTNE